MIIAKLDTTKINGVKFLQKDGRKFLEITDAGLYEGKNGAVYLDFVLFDTPDDKYGNDWRVCQSVSQEARQRGEKGPILGNGKNKGQAQAQRPTATGSAGAKPTHSPAGPADDTDSDVPFNYEKGI